MAWPRRQQVVHHSNRGSQYLSIRYTERLTEAGAQPSMGSVGDAYDNALAETITGLYKTEVIHRLGLWRHLETVEYATLEWVDWFNHRRLLEPIGNVPPQSLRHRIIILWVSCPWQHDSNPELSGKVGAVHHAFAIGWGSALLYARDPCSADYTMSIIWHPLLLDWPWIP